MSELAEIRARIDQEIESMNLALQGYAVTTRHEIINHQYSMLEIYRQELRPHLGDQGALQAIINALDSLDPNGSSQHC